MSKTKRSPNQSSQPRTIDELKAAAQHLRYERAMLMFTGARLTKEPLPQGLDYAVLMESFLIHVRNLNEFFFGLDMAKEGKKTVFQNDMVVEDFFEYQKQWAKPQSKRLSDDLRQQINDQLTHLTYARKVGHYHDWDFVNLQNRMNCIVDSFFQSIDPNKV